MAGPAAAALRRSGRRRGRAADRAARGRNDLAGPVRGGEFHARHGEPAEHRPAGARVAYVPGAALVVRKAAAGAGFAAGMYVGEDVDFVWRMATAGWRVRYEPAAVMGHDHRVRFRAWFGRRRDYGTSAAALEQLHPGVVRPLHTSWWTVGAWAAALSGRPGIAVTLTGTATALLARRLSRVTGERWPLPAASGASDAASGPAQTPTPDNSKKRAHA